MPKSTMFLRRPHISLWHLVNKYINLIMPEDTHHVTYGQTVVVCCSVLQCVAVCCSVLQFVAMFLRRPNIAFWHPTRTRSPESSNTRMPDSILFLLRKFHKISIVIAEKSSALGSHTRTPDSISISITQMSWEIQCYCGTKLCSKSPESLHTKMPNLSTENLRSGYKILF